MINDLDEVLRTLLIEELPIKNGEVDISFDLPNREWSARLNRPTLNLFLYDLRENTTLRQPEWQIKRDGDGTAKKRRSPVRMDLHYIITAWAKEALDEHHLLTRTLMVLFRHPILPKHLLPEILQAQPVDIPVQVAQTDILRNIADIWSALENDLRPAIACSITLALNPYQTFEGPLVHTRELRWLQADKLPTPYPEEDTYLADEIWMVGGVVQSAEPLADAHVTLQERGLRVPVKEEGLFIIGNLEPGTYTLLLEAEGRKTSQHPIEVPSEDYVIQA
jgi:hypothetical protein